MLMKKIKDFLKKIMINGLLVFLSFFLTLLLIEGELVLLERQDLGRNPKLFKTMQREINTFNWKYALHNPFFGYGYRFTDEIHTFNNKLGNYRKLENIN